MRVGFFDLVFECNSKRDCDNSCPYKNQCIEFFHCFDNIPSIVWAHITSLDDISECVSKWREYNEQTVE